MDAELKFVVVACVDGERSDNQSRERERGRVELRTIVFLLSGLFSRSVVNTQVRKPEVLSRGNI